MTLLETINALTAMIGIPATLGGFIYIGRKLQTLDTLEKNVGGLKHNVKTLADYLTRNHNEFDPKELHALSPVQLTERGTLTVQELGFTNVFKAHQNDFFSYIDKESPKYKYDVERAAIQSIHVLSEKEYMQFLKVFFYNNPTRDLANTAPTLGIYVRDQYLAAHPEITQ